MRFDFDTVGVANSLSLRGGPALRRTAGPEGVTMFAVEMVRGVLAGQTDGVTGLAALAVSPAVALVEAGAAAVDAVRSGLRGLRHKLAVGLRRLADRIEAPAPVARLVVPDPRTGSVMYADEALPAPVVEVVPEAPVILPVAVPMPSAAQVTRPESWEDIAAPLVKAVEEHGGVRAAARALGIAESTLRSRVKRAGLTLPGRKAKG